VANGIEIRLFDGATAQASLTGLTCLWWDAEDVYDLDYPQGRTNSATTDADGDLILDISEVSGHSVGGVGYLLVRKEDTLDHEDSLVFQGKVTVASITGGTVLEYNSGWVRPTEWLAIDDVHSSGESRFEGLHAVFKGCPNLVAFTFTVTGGYDVDWGDGSAIEAVASGVKAEHSFDYDDCDAASEMGISDARAVTFTDAGDLVTLASHGFQNGTEIAFSVVTTTTGITAYTRYWVVGVSGDNFQVAATNGGAAIALTNNGSGSVYLPRYRQVVIKVTPTTSNHFTTVNLNSRHTTISGITYQRMWLDVYLNGPSITALTVCGDRWSIVERINIPEQGDNTIASLFAGCAELQDVYIDSSGATDMSSMFIECRSLKSIPLLNTASATNLTNFLNACSSLRSIPLLNTASCSNFTGFVNGGYALRSFPAIVTSAGTNFSSMFQNTSISKIPLIYTSIGKNFTSMFNGAVGLSDIPLLNTSAGTTFSTMFQYSAGYSGLSSVPLLDLSSWTTLTNMFLNCTALQKGALSGTKESITYAAGSLSGAALDEIYTNLATVVGKTITVTGNYGTSSDDPTIATAKGWTVTS